MRKNTCKSQVIHLLKRPLPGGYLCHIKQIMNNLKQRAMKPRKIIAATGLFLLAIIMINASIFAGNKINASRQPLPVAIHITYVVNVELDGIPNPAGISLIEIRDQFNRPISQPQQFIPGVLKYVFVENGVKINGIHSAHFNASSNSSKVVWSKDAKAGPFYGGQIYSFHLYPIQ